MRRGQAIVVGGAMLCGCDTVFDLDYLDIPEVVTGSYRVRMAVLDAAQVAHTFDGPAPFTVALEVVRADGTTRPVTINAEGDFSFQTDPGVPFRLVVQAAPEPVPTEFQLTSPTITIRPSFFDRLDHREPVTQQTLVTFNMALPNRGVGDFSRIAATGVRAYAAAFGTDIDAVILDWAMASGLGSTIALLDSSPPYFDQLYYLHYLTGSNPDVNTIGDAYTGQVMMTSGTTVSVGTSTSPVSTTPVAANRCAHITASASAELLRVSREIGATNEASTAANWDLSSTPLAELGPGKLLPIAYSRNASSIAIAQDTDVRFGNPFGDAEAVVARMSVFVHRTFQVPGGTPTAPPPAIGTTTTVAVPATTCPTVTMPDSAIALAVSTSLGGQPLIENEQRMIDRSSPVMFTFETGETGTFDDVSITLNELVAPPGGGITRLDPQRSYVTTGKSILVDPKHLVVGHYYTFAINLRIGFPGAKLGDYGLSSYPQIRAGSYSPMFRVAN